jgi:uncharacterized protein DUF4272
MMSDVDVSMIRQRSLFMARRLGYPVDVSLPLMVDRGVLRGKDEVVDRMLVLDVMIGCASGLPPEIGAEWMEEAGIRGAVSPSEWGVLAGRPEEVPVRLLDRMEGLWALGWAASIFRVLDFGRICGPEMAIIVGDIEDIRGVRALRKRAKMRRYEEVLAACDLARCLHRGLSLAERGGARSPGKLQPHVVIERRRALEWLLAEEPWDDIVVRG